MRTRKLKRKNNISLADKGRAYKLKLETIKKIRQQTQVNRDFQTFSQLWEKGKEIDEFIRIVISIETRNIFDIKD